jgi:hypothetical protein
MKKKRSRRILNVVARIVDEMDLLMNRLFIPFYDFDVAGEGKETEDADGASH